MSPSSPIFFFPISKLAHFVFCPKRSKRELFHQVYGISTESGRTAIVAGNRMHKQYEYLFSNIGFSRLLLKSKLKAVAKTERGRKVFTKQVDNIVVLGMYDDLRVISYNGKLYCSLLELKTTSKKYVWSKEVMSSVKQLQLYMWAMKDVLESLGFPLWKRGYVEWYSQKTGERIRRIPVEYDPNIEDWIRYVVRCFQGLEKVQVPEFKICKMCPKNVRDGCDWYALRKPKKSELPWL